MTTTRTSFLFIVNELPTNDDPDSAGGILPEAADGRYRPPIRRRGFLAPVPGYVFRWRAGEVSEANGYFWSGQHDTVLADMETHNVWPERYETATVFYCNPFDKFFTARGDASSRDSYEPENLWHPLTFFHENNRSLLDHAGDQHYLTVRRASWIEELLPNAYRRRAREGPTSGGLGGSLPIAIALIAFSCHNNEELYRVLMHDRAWRDNRWVRHGRESGRIEGRGMVVTVYLDPENCEGSTFQTISNLERGSIFR